ncbi:hypothetical protein [Halalkalibacterium ligniniphilum]|uniref:hypothetical protein n=1 Tax=Halalkalibacterium ligniniphilum TaxID=1134413 RepID=UPI0003456CED|nr:hypothetical protein [Halalkalibacterium ligniniphilum]
MHSRQRPAAPTRTESVFDVNFHHFIEKEQERTSFELASEFGISLHDVRLLKNKLSRN